MLGLLILPGLDEQATDTINSTAMAREICNRLIFRFIISCEMDGKPLWNKYNRLVQAGQVELMGKRS
jgi:hypothetical protein